MKWFCNDCKCEEHPCFVCGVQGKDLIDVCKCSLSSCGKYYHAECLLNAGNDFLSIPVKFLDNNHDALKKQNIANSACGSASVISTIPDPSQVVAVSLTRERKRKGRPSLKSLKSSESSSSSASINLNIVDAGEPIATVDKSSATISESSATIDQPTITHGDNGLSSSSIMKPLNNNSFSETAAANKMNKAAFSFKCPYHHCFTCAPSYAFKERSTHKELQRCVFCPRAFHTSCIAPGCRYNNICLLCPRHPEKVLPLERKPVETSSTVQDFDSNVDAEEIVGTVNQATLQLFYEQISIAANPLPRATHVEDDHYFLPRRFLDESKVEPRPFKSISRLDYTEFAKSVSVTHAEVDCNCKEECGFGCHNRQSRVECDDSICNVGKLCGNRRLQCNQYAKYERFQEFEMGWGLRAKEAVSRDSLIIEYVGEVIDNKEKERRLTNQRFNTPSDKDYYIMALGTL